MPKKEVFEIAKQRNGSVSIFNLPVTNVLLEFKAPGLTCAELIAKESAITSSEVTLSGPQCQEAASSTSKRAGRRGGSDRN